MLTLRSEPPTWDDLPQAEQAEQAHEAEVAAALLEHHQHPHAGWFRCLAAEIQEDASLPEAPVPV